jgi:lipid II:glycine glycyltransferase (peptidoglycan interpeptide bridge formation enzyme)
MAKFERVTLDPAGWGRTLSTFSDANVFQSPAWLAFLAETQNAEPILAVLKEGNETLGYFTGLIIKKFGLKILGSPFRGWSTPYMGFNLRPEVPRQLAAEALKPFAFGELGCIHFEVVDLGMRSEMIGGLDLIHEPRTTLEVDLMQSEDALFGNMTSSCRRNIRKAEKNGVVIEEARDMAFADEYADQFKDVFDKQGMVPFYGAERMRALIKHLLPTGTMVMFRARDSQGRCIATGAYPALGQIAFYWGGASWREHQKLCPNELLQWSAMKYWKQRGMKIYNLVGAMEFKQRFGGHPVPVIMVGKSKYRIVSQMRSSLPRAAKAAVALAWKVKNAVKGGKPAAPAEEQ